METKTQKNGAKIGSHREYTDKYFLRTREILEAEGLDPWIRARVFIRKGPGEVQGVDEALDILNSYSPLVENGGRVYALRDGDRYDSKETLMVIEAPVQDVVELETMYLGVLSAETTKANDGYSVDLERVRENMAAVVDATIGRPVIYMGARHWRYDEDAAISRAAFEGGASSTSTDIGAAIVGQKGVGTIPHALENIMAWKYGYERAVVEATKAFDRVIDPSVPRIALVDYANREIDDSIAVANALGDRLFGIRIDTCGENHGQGAIRPDDKRTVASLAERLGLGLDDERTMNYVFGKGVSVTAVSAVRRALDWTGHSDKKIILSSGFGKVDKINAFVNAEEKLGYKLFDGLGVGGVFPARMATMDIVAVGETPRDLVAVSKIGREYNPNDRLELRLGGRR